MAVDRLRNNRIIILDTNALFIPFEFNINIDSELLRLFGDYQIVIPSCVFSELKRLSRTQKYGKMALDLAETKAQPKWYKDFEPDFLLELKKLPRRYDENPIDNQILEIAIELNGIVLTNDRNFLNKLEIAGVKTISLRKKKYLTTSFQI